MSKKYIIFDFDGTLINTNDVIVDSWQATFRHFLGHELSRREIESHFGETLMDTIAKYFPEEQHIAARDHYRKYQVEHCQGMVYVYDGIRALLAALKERGCMIGVATSRTASSMWEYLNEHGIGEFIDVAVTMDDVTHHKPHRETVDRVIEKFGGTPEESIMLGDTKYDVGCAMNAGVDSVLVGWSHYVDFDDMTADGCVPTYQLEHPMDLLEII